MVLTDQQRSNRFGTMSRTTMTKIKKLRIFSCACEVSILSALLSFLLLCDGGVDECSSFFFIVVFW